MTFLIDSSNAFSSVFSSPRFFFNSNKKSNTFSASISLSGAIAKDAPAFKNAFAILLPSLLLPLKQLSERIILPSYFIFSISSIVSSSFFPCELSNSIPFPSSPE